MIGVRVRVLVQTLRVDEEDEEGDRHGDVVAREVEQHRLLVVHFDE